LVQDTSVKSAQPEAVPELPGEFYIEFLRRFHAVLGPQTYLEIGSRTGDSLALAQCASIAVDPGFALAPHFLGRKPLCSLHQITSDRFFQAFDPCAILRGPIDFAFLDGLHLAEALVRDFANTERSCRRNSIIAMHDCVPTDLPMARRAEADFALMHASRHPGRWTGDVWKAVLVLRKFRPDLRIHAFDAEPTGLIMVTNLDPASRVLLDNYDTILAEIRELDLQRVGIASYIASLDLIPTRSVQSLDEFSRYFWL
jgi:predicted O-methyltransferase YrrM